MSIWSAAPIRLIVSIIIAVKKDTVTRGRCGITPKTHVGKQGVRLHSTLGGFSFGLKMVPETT